MRLSCLLCPAILFDDYMLVAINGAGKEFRSQQLGSVESRNRGRADSREFQELLRLGQASSLEAVQRVLAPVLPAWKENPRLSTAILCRLAKKKCARTCMKVGPSYKEECQVVVVKDELEQFLSI